MWSHMAKQVLLARSRGAQTEASSCSCCMGLPELLLGQLPAQGSGPSGIFQNLDSTRVGWLVFFHSEECSFSELCHQESEKAETGS